MFSERSSFCRPFPSFLSVENPEYLCFFNASNNRVKQRRNITVKRVTAKETDHGYVPGTMAERLLMVWPMTRDAYAFSPKAEDAERRLQRHVAVSSRR